MLIRWFLEVKKNKVVEKEKKSEKEKKRKKKEKKVLKKKKCVQISDACWCNKCAKKIDEV